jgi:hypothetical protein
MLLLQNFVNNKNNRAKFFIILATIQLSLIFYIYMFIGIIIAFFS